MHQEDELRRIDRTGVCCRVDVRDRRRVWTAVTEDLCDRGCRVVTARVPRIGSLLAMTLSSDAISESLEVLGRVVWVSPDRVGVEFVEPADCGLTPTEWVARVKEHGRVGAPGARGVGAAHVLPVVRAARDAQERGGDVVQLPVPRR